MQQIRWRRHIRCCSTPLLALSWLLTAIVIRSNLAEFCDGQPIIKVAAKWVWRTDCRSRA